MKYSDRSKTPIEPYLSDQWFVKMGDHGRGKPGFAQTAMDAVTAGKVKFFPERYAKSYLDWLGEKRDWCISRQLWWGHRIPHLVCALLGGGTAEGVCQSQRCDMAARRGERSVARLRPWMMLPMQSPGIRTPWDSPKTPTYSTPGSAPRLWPHSTLGWPGPALPDQLPGPQNPEWAQMRYYYPTSVLVTNRDIISLWVARMVIASLYNVNEVPFHHVYIHPKILDAFGEGMSKMKGNGVDPLDIIELYGADALRFGMVHLSTENQDSKLPVSNVCPHCGASGGGETRAYVPAYAETHLSGVQKAVPAGRAVAEAGPRSAHGEARIRKV